MKKPGAETEGPCAGNLPSPDWITWESRDNGGETSFACDHLSEMR
jgi:hypothetical protein